MATILRDYQTRAVAGVEAAWRVGRRSVLLVAPTGSGKTAMGAAVVRGALSAGKRVLWVAHTRELVMQAAARLRADGVQGVSIIAGGATWAERGASVTVASVQSLLARSGLPAADVIVFDEAHHYAARQWRAVARSYPGAQILGMTATPERTDGAPLGDLFDELVVAAQPRELVERGYIVPCEIFTPELDQAGLLARAPLEAWQRWGRGRRSIVFVRRREEAARIASEIVAAGGLAAAVDGETPTGERDEALERFADGQLDALVNVGVLTEGWDCPEADTIIICRSCSGAGTYLQMAGRGARVAADKVIYRLVDLAGNVARHGKPSDEREYKLHGKVGIERAEPQPADVSQPEPERTPEPPAVTPITGDELVRIAASRREMFMHLVERALREERPSGWVAKQIEAAFAS